MIRVTINGRAVTIERPVTVLDAARSAGIHIPHFCNHPLLEKFGGCRMCLVQVEDMPRLQTSCTLMVTDGMSIETESPDVVKARRSILEFLLINHPLECPTCDKAGECRLQNYTMLYGPDAGRFEEKKRNVPESVDDPLIVRNMERCIMCTRCVRMCDGVQGASAISVIGRGGRSYIEPFSSGRFDCEYCGNCISVCPVGSIMSSLHRYSYRPWQVDRQVTTICPYCGVGCSMVVQSREEKICRVIAKPALGTNNGILCARGYFGYGYVSSPSRLDRPLLRKSGGLSPVSWEEALGSIAGRLQRILDEDGGKAIGGIASARCTNEDNYLFQKLMRAGLGTNNIDSSARMGYAGALRVLEGLLGPGITANEMRHIQRSDAVLVAGADPTRLSPVLGVQVRGAYRKGAGVVTLGFALGLAMHTTCAVQCMPGDEGPALSSLLGEVIKKRILTGRRAELERDLEARDFPAAAPDVERAASVLAKAPSVSILIAPELVARSQGASNMAALGALAHVLDARVYLMSERPNDQGVLDMGCLPDELAGGGLVSEGEARGEFEAAWGRVLPDWEGLSLMEMVEASHSGSLKAMFVMGENPAFNLPDTGFVRKALERLDLLIVQDIFLTETAQMAHAVLPSQSWAEKDGTFTNLERRMQRLSPSIRSQALPDWKILADLGERFGIDMKYGSSEDIMREISSLSPRHKGLTYKALDDGLGLWPYKGSTRRSYIHLNFKDIYSKPVQTPRGPLNIVLDRSLFHSGTTSRQSEALCSVHARPEARMARATGEAFSLADGDLVEVSTDKGTLTLPVRIERGLPDGNIFLTNTFKRTGVFFLFGYNIEPLTKALITETTGVQVRKRSK